MEMIGRPWQLIAVVSAFVVLDTVAIVAAGDSFGRDDWDFAATALRLADQGQLWFSDFPSMTLLSHVVWGAAFAKVFGVTATSLRISTLVLAITGGLALHAIARRHGRSRAAAAFLVAGYLFHPMVFDFASTFFTDVFGCSLLLISLDLIDRDHWMQRKMSGLAIAAVTAVAYLGRQTASIASIGWWVATAVFDPSRRWRATGVMVLAVVPIVAFMIFLHQGHGLPINHEKAFLEFGIFGRPKMLVAKAMRLVIGFGCWTLPLSLAWFVRGRWVGFVAAVFVVTGAGAALGDVHESLLPYWNDTLHNGILGYRPPIRGIESAWAWTFAWGTQPVQWFTGLTVAAGSASCLAWSKGIADRRGVMITHWRATDPATRSLRVVWVTWGGGFLLLILIGDVFDRYLLPLVATSLVGLAICRPATTRLPMAAWLVAVLVSLWGVNASIETKRTYRKIWEASHRLIERGIPASEIEADGALWGAFTYRPRFDDRRVAAGGDLRAMDRARREAWLRPRERKRFRFVTEPEADEFVLRRIRVHGLIRSIEFYLVGQSG